MATDPGQRDRIAQSLGAATRIAPRMTQPWGERVLVTRLATRDNAADADKTPLEG